MIKTERQMILKQTNTDTGKRSYIKTESAGWRQISNVEFQKRCAQIHYLTATVIATAIPGGFETRVVG